MTKMQWTPGPWSVENPMGPEELTIVANGDAPVYDWRWIASVSLMSELDDTHPIGAEARANARLIAAAPDLFTALDDLLEAWAKTGSTISARTYDAAVAALAKARGED